MATSGKQEKINCIIESTENKKSVLQSKVVSPVRKDTNIRFHFLLSCYKDCQRERDIIYKSGIHVHNLVYLSVNVEEKEGLLCLCVFNVVG